jgi:hypothetical protein
MDGERFSRRNPLLIGDPEEMCLSTRVYQLLAFSFPVEELAGVQCCQQELNVVNRSLHGVLLKQWPPHCKSPSASGTPCSIGAVMRL